MSFRIREGEVEGLANSPPSTALQEVVDAARRGYCALYSGNPALVFAKNTTIAPIVSNTLGRFCGDFPPPPPPPPSNFSGGQCEGVSYRVFATYQFTVSGSDNVNDRAEILNTVEGKITGVTTNSDSGGQFVLISVVTTASATPINVQKNLGQFSSLVPGSLVVTFPPVVPEEDICGDPPPPPYDEVPPPTVEERSINVSVTNSSNVTNNYTGSINVSLDGQVTFPPVINIGGISVTLDVGGAVVSNETNNYSGGGDGNGGEKVAEEQEPPPPLIEEEELEEEEQPEPKTVENLVAILIDAVGDESVFDSSSGRGAPDVFYIGWVEFKNGGYYYPREFIHFKSSRFQAPEENDGYAITYKKGWAGTVTEITETAPEPEA